MFLKRYAPFQANLSGPQRATNSLQGTPKQMVLLAAQRYGLDNRRYLNIRPQTIREIGQPIP